MSECIGAELRKVNGFGVCPMEPNIILGCGHKVCQECGETMLGLGRLKSFALPCPDCIEAKKKLGEWEQAARGWKLRVVP